MKTKMLMLFFATISTMATAQKTELTIAPEHVVREFLFAVQQGDHEKLKTLLHPNVQWEQPGNNRLSGTKKSMAEVFEMGRIMGEWSEKTVKLAAIRQCGVNGNTVAVQLRWTAAQPTGNVLDVSNIDIYTVENGKITQVKIFSENILQEDRFWGK